MGFSLPFQLSCTFVVAVVVLGFFSFSTNSINRCALDLLTIILRFKLGADAHFACWLTLTFKICRACWCKDYFWVFRQLTCTRHRNPQHFFPIRLGYFIYYACPCVKIQVFLFYVLFIEYITYLTGLVHKTGVIQAHDGKNWEYHLNGCLHRLWTRYCPFNYVQPLKKKWCLDCTPTSLL